MADVRCKSLNRHILTQNHPIWINFDTQQQGLDDSHDQI